TLLNIEGVGRMLDPDIDIWAVAHPVLKRILRERYSPRRALRTMRQHLPEWLRAAPNMPGLVHQLLEETVNGQTRVHFSSQDLSRLHTEARHIRHLLAGGLLGVTFGISAVLMWTLAPEYGIGWPIGLACAAVITFVASWPRGH